MKLFLKRDISMEHTRFLVFDYRGDLKYVVTGKRQGTIDRMAVSSTDSQVLVSINSVPTRLFSAFIISCNHHRISMIAKNPCKCSEFRFRGIDWTMCKSADRRSFEIIDSRGNQVMYHSADDLKKTRTYTLEIFDETNELYCVAAAICADVINYADSAVAATV